MSFLYWADGTYIDQYSSVSAAQTAATAMVQTGQTIEWKRGPSANVWHGYISGTPMFVIRGTGSGNGSG